MKVLRSSKDASVICGDFQLYLPRADLSFSGQQWKNFMELLKGSNIFYPARAILFGCSLLAIAGVVGCFTRTDQEYSLYKDLGKNDSRSKGT